MSELAYVGSDGQVHLCERDGSGHRQLTLSVAQNPLLLWGRPDLAHTNHAWPTWSPDGQHVLCFEYPDGGQAHGPAKVHLLDLDGVRQVELLSVEGRVPIYAAWHPDGSGVLILMQGEDRLVLGWVDRHQPGRLRVLEEGAPLFFHFGPDRTLLVHAGSGSDARVTVRDLDGRRPDIAFPEPPGNYCVPIVTGERVVHVVRRGPSNVLVSSAHDGTDSRDLLEFSGLGAIVPVPGREQVVFSAAPEGEGTPYGGATLVDLAEDRLQRLTDDECLAFSWSPSADALVYAQVLQDANCIAWKRVAPGEEPTELARFWPSREMLFYLHFFDQFTLSHMLVSPDGGALLFAGRLMGRDSPTGPPQVFVAGLEEGQGPRVVAGGVFGCFAPRVTAGQQQPFAQEQ